MANDRTHDPADSALAAQTQMMIRRSPSAIAVTDAHDVIIEWNPEAASLFGYERDEAVGRELGDLVLPAEHADVHRQAVATFLRDGDSGGLERNVIVACRHRDGNRLWALLSSGAITSNHGDPLFIVWLRQMHRRNDERRSDPELGSTLETLINNVSDVITVLDPHGQWISSSGAGSRILGWEPNLDPEGGIYALVHPDDIDATLTALGEVLDGTRGNDEPIDIRVMDARGNYHVLETVAENLIDDPRVGGVVLTSRDVTAARAAHDELVAATALLSALVASFADGVIVIDENRRVVRANQALIEMFELDATPDDLIGLDTDLIADAVSDIFTDPEGTQAQLRHRIDDDEPSFGEVLTMLDGRLFERDSIPIIDESGARRHMWVHRDITEREELARRRTDQLEDSRRAHSLAQEQHRALLELTEMRSQFVATISHELRTPLASIVSFADLLRGDLADDAFAEQLTFVDAIERNAQRLLRLVNDLLLLRQVEAGAMALVPTTGSVDDLVRGAVRVLEPLAAARRQQLRFNVEPGPPITADLGRLDQVLVNLISNAVKYTPEEGIIDVTARADASAWTIAVRDTGVGIGADELEHLFEHFYRGTRSSTGTSGTGLGLVISKAVVELHGGTIEVSSTVGEGTTMTVELPLAPPEPASNATPDATATPSFQFTPGGHISTPGDQS